MEVKELLETAPGEYVVSEETQIQVLEKKVKLYEDQLKDIQKKYNEREADFQKKIDEHIYADEAFVEIIAELKKYSGYVQKAQEVINDLQKHNEELSIELASRPKKKKK
jgi:indole-3-glycerol phosphate synthase